MTNNSITSVTDKLVKLLNDTADHVYMRNDNCEIEFLPAMKQILSYTDIYGRLDLDEEVKADRLNFLSRKFGELVSAYEEKDYILAADILHHEFAEEIGRWMK